MGIHSGSVNQVRDVNDRSNVTGAGINMAQRVMDCGDAGHILLSQRVAEDLDQYRRWRPYLHDLGECEVKHGVRVRVFNLYTDEIGNRDVPAKLKPIAQEPAAAVAASAGESARSKNRLIATTVLLMIALALGFGFWVVSHRAAPKSTGNSPKRSPNSPAPAEIGKPLDLPALAQKARGAVALIVGYDAAGKMITGSGFFVSADGRLVTNYHVIEGIVNAQAKLEGGAIYNIDGLLASSSALDLALLKAGARDMQFLLVDDASNPPQPGTRVAVIGSPLALEGSLSEGIVSAIRSRLDGSWLLQMSAPISPGSSGSPVLDRHGRVVGVATLTAEQGQNLNFARSSHDLWNFLLTIDQDAKPKALSEEKDQILSDPAFIAARDANSRGDGAAALKLLNTLQQRYPSEPRLLFQFAYAYEALGLHDEAYRSWRAYIDIDPTDPAAWRHFAVAAANLNRINEAINAYKQTLKMKPDADTWRLLGDLYDAQGQYALGTQAHDEAKRLDSEKKLAGASSTASESPVSHRLPEKAAPEASDEGIQTFIQAFVRDMASNDATLQMRYYSNPCRYYDQATIALPAIRKDIERDIAAWKKRAYSLHTQPLIRKTETLEYAVTFEMAYTLEDPKPRSSGILAMSLRLKQENGTFLTTEIQKKVILARRRTIGPEPSAPGETGAQKLTRVYVKKYGVSALLPTDVFPDAKKLSNSDESFLQGNSWTGQTTLTFSSVREPLAKVYAECATEHSP
jgi:S1-C subfamily serine protease